MTNELLLSIGLARKAGKLLVGFDAVSEGCKEGTARLIILAADLSPKSRKEIVRTADQYGVRWFDAPFTMEDTEKLLKRRVGIMAVGDDGFAKMLEKHLPEQVKEDQIV